MKHVITCATTRSVSVMATLPAWASLLTHAGIKEGFVNGYVADSDVHKVLELHGRACLTKR